MGIPADQLIENAWTHAQLIAARYIAGVSCTRRECGMPDRQWDWGMALIKSAGLFGNGEIVPDMQPVILKLLFAHYKDLKRTGNVAGLQRHRTYR